MYSGGDAADQMVRYAYQGGEIILKLTGAGAKNLAAYLANVLKNPNPTPGQTKLKRMLRDGRELTVQPLPTKKMREFRAEAKRYGIQFCVLKDTKNGRTCDILVRAEDASRVNRIMDRLGIDNELYGHIHSEQARERPKEQSRNPTRSKTRREKKKSPTAGRSTSSRPSSPTSKEKLHTAGNGAKMTPERPSVLAQLAAIVAASAKNAKEVGVQGRDAQKRQSER